MLAAVFYQMSSFIPMSVKNIRREKPPYPVLDNCKSAHYNRQIISYFDVMSCQRVGILEGEYALICDCNLLVARDGTVVRSASSWEEPFSTKNITELCTTNQFVNAVDNVVGVFWDRSPIIDSPAILTGMPLENYFHFSLEIVPRIRHFPAEYLDKVMIPERALRLPFQRSLLVRAGSGCTFIRAPEVIRVRNPIVSHDFMSEDSIRWLHQIGPRAKRGHRRLYIRRGSESGRTLAGGGLEETAELLDMLSELNFEFVEFGSGKTVDEQVSMLDGAGLILSAHGAALTNITYLEEGVSVLEIIGAMTPRPLYMHICAVLKLNYRAILTDAYTEGRDIKLDVETVRDCILSLQ